MSKKLIVEGESIKDAVKIAADQLGVPARYLSYKVLEQGRTGLLGIFSKSWRLLVYEKEIDPMSLPGVAAAVSASHNQDGHFDIKFEGKDILVTVHPPCGVGRPVNAQAIIHYLKGLDAQEIFTDLVSLATMSNFGKPVKVGVRQVTPDQDAYARIELDPDLMLAHMTIIPPEGQGKKIGKHEIMATLHKQGIVFGIKEDIIDQLFAQQKYNTRVLIAEGKPVAAGSDARIELKFEPDQLLPRFAPDDFGRIDLREMNLIEVTRAGDAVAVKTLPTPGLPGKRLDGRVIPARDGKDVELRFDPSVTFDKTTNRFIAARDGQPVLKDGRLSIREVLTIAGDVNYGTGNIDFTGSIEIKGSIEDNFRVTAAGDIIVHKHIGKALVRAGRDIKVQGGIIGKAAGAVQAGRDIVARFVEQANLVALRNVIISELCFHSNVDSGGSIILPGKRGQLAGGVIRAAHHIMAREIGAIGAPHTRVVAGIDPAFLNELQEYQLKLIETMDMIKNLEEAVARLDQHRSGEPLDSRREMEYGEIKKSLIDLRSKEKDLQHLIDQAKDRPTGGRDATISAADKVHIGVNIEINRMPLVVMKQEYKFVTFKAKTDGIDFMPFQDSLLKKLGIAVAER